VCGLAKGGEVDFNGTKVGDVSKIFLTREIRSNGRSREDRL
jgi:ABC-type transporter Mla subunit MlaD